MIHYIKINGADKPADFSIMTVAQIAAVNGTDITGLVERIQKYSTEAEYLEFVASAGAVALNAGAKRESTGEKFTEFDLYDALSLDMSIAQVIIDKLFGSMNGNAVFQQPPVAAAPKRPKSKKNNE